MIYPGLACIFVHIPKTGGTSIENALAGLDPSVGGHSHDHRSLWQIDPRRPLLSYAAAPRVALPYLREAARLARADRGGVRIAAADYDRFVKVAFVRNPWGRAVSWYRNVLRDPRHRQRHGCTPQTPFPDFLARFAGKGMLKPQTFWLRDRTGRIGVDHIGRFETLADDFADLVRNRFGRTASLPHMLQGGTDDFRPYYSDDDAARVARIYADEIARFGYGFDD